MLRGCSWHAMAVAVVTTGVLTDGLMFHSDAVTSQWDTWAFVENGTFYVSGKTLPKLRLCNSDAHTVNSHKLELPHASTRPQTTHRTMAMLSAHRPTI